MTNRTPSIPLVRGNIKSIALEGLAYLTGNAVLALRLVVYSWLAGKLCFSIEVSPVDQVISIW